MNKKDVDWDTVQYSGWCEWERTFVFIPKRDVNKKLIFGRAWKRERYGSVMGKLDKETNISLVYTITDTAYAKEKEVFIRKLQDAIQ